MKGLYWIGLTTLLSQVLALFDPKSNSNVVYYWGQNSASVGSNDPTHAHWQKPLSEYCSNPEVDILVISFLHKFGEGRSSSFDIANSGKDCLGFIPGTELMNCPNMEKDIQFCQENHKKILLSMGGATPEYGLKSTQEGERLADELWNTFGGGHGFDRPFGLATVDGFDLDIENGANQGYPAFVKRMREHYATDKSKEYYIAAAPQCPFPDFFLGDTLDQSWFDFVMVQFYNNYCNVINGEQFNYQIWHDWAQKTSINKDVRLFVGIPGSPSAAGRGYVPFEQLTKTIAPLQTLSSFGGVMVWDVSQAYGNQQDVLPSYAHGISRLIHGERITPNAPAMPKAPSVPNAPAMPKTPSVPNAPAMPKAPSVPDSPSVSKTPLLPKPSQAAIEDEKTNKVPMLDKTHPIFNDPPRVYPEPAHTDPTISQGARCEVNGMLRCSGKTSYGQCSNGAWVVRTCPIVTVCKENGESVYCGFA